MFTCFLILFNVFTWQLKIIYVAQVIFLLDGALLELNSQGLLFSNNPINKLEFCNIHKVNEEWRKLQSRAVVLGPVKKGGYIILETEKDTETIWGNSEGVYFSLKLKENIWSRMNWFPRNQKTSGHWSWTKIHSTKVNNQGQDGPKEWVWGWFYNREAWGEMEPYFQLNKVGSGSSGWSLMSCQTKVQLGSTRVAV